MLAFIVVYFAGIATAFVGLDIASRTAAARAFYRATGQAREDTLIENHVRRRAETARLVGRAS